MKRYFYCLQFMFSMLIMLVPFNSGANTEIKTGAFQLKATLPELLDVESQKTYSSVINMNEVIEWEVYVSKKYRPDKNPGLMVYISPTRSGKIPKQWLSLMDEYNLIWVAANQSGNNIDSRKRLMMAILATYVIDKNYSINLDRIYVSGLSGGGRMASISASLLPQLFKGAIFNCGVNFWGNIPPENIEAIKNNRFVFITGRNDFNLNDTKQVYRKYKKVGVKNVMLLINPIMGHFNPNKKDFEKAIRFLDSA